MCDCGESFIALNTQPRSQSLFLGSLGLRLAIDDTGIMYLHPTFLHRLRPSEIHCSEWFLSRLYQQPFPLSGWKRPTEHPTVAVNRYAECGPLCMQTLESGIEPYLDRSYSSY